MKFRFQHYTMLFVVVYESSDSIEFHAVRDTEKYYFDIVGTGRF